MRNSSHFICVRGRILIQNSGHLWTCASVCSCVGRSMGAAALTYLPVLSNLLMVEKAPAFSVREFSKGMG